MEEQCGVKTEATMRIAEHQRTDSRKQRIDARYTKRRHLRKTEHILGAGASQYVQRSHM